MEPSQAQAVRFLRLSRFQRDRVLGHLLRLDAEDRACRFGAALGDDELRAYGERIDWTRTLMIGAEVGGELRAVGELKMVGDGWREPGAEVAITVEGPLQGRGIGGELLRRLVTLARNRGVRTLCTVCLARNRRVQRMVRHLGAELTEYGGELEGQIDLPRPGYASLAEEVIDAWAGALPRRPPPVAPAAARPAAPA